MQTAFRETADALAAVDTLSREVTALAELADSSGQGLRLSELRYRQGVDNHLRYLNAQRRSFTDQSAMIEVVTERQLATLALFTALGGGWQEERQAAAAGTSTQGVAP